MMRSQSDRRARFRPGGGRRAWPRAALVLALVLWALPAAADNTIGSSCSSVGQSGNSAREADGNNEWCNGSTWQYPAYQLGSTTSGCSSTNAGQVQYTSGTLEVCNGSSWVSVDSSGISFISTQTASNSSSLQFTNLPTSYSTLFLNCSGLFTSISGNGSLQLYVGEGSTPTWETASDYTGLGSWACNNGSGTSYGQSDSEETGTSLISPYDTPTTVTSFKLYLYNYNSSTVLKTAYFQAAQINGSNASMCWANGTSNWPVDTNPITGLELKPTSGTINAGECTLYGLDPTVWTGPLASGYGDDTSCSSSPCTTTITSTHGGDLLMVGAYYNTAPTSITAVTSAACPGGWVLNPGTTNVNYGAGSAGQTFAYCLSDAAGITSISVTMTSIANFQVLEFSSNGTPITVDGTPVGSTITGNGSTMTGETLSPTGNDLLIQLEHGCANNVSPYINEGYTLLPSGNDNPGTWAGALNSSTGTAPTWYTTANYGCLGAGFAFK